MPRRSLLVVLLCGCITTGCSAMQKPHRAVNVGSWADVSSESSSRFRANTSTAPETQRTVSQKTAAGPHAADRFAATAEQDGWLARTRRHLDQVSKEIRADLDFHDTEGLEGFSPDAVEQVNMLRGDMNRSGGITRERE